MDIDARTTILIALANSAGLLKIAFPGKELKMYKKRIKVISNGVYIGQATREAIEAVQAAVAVAAAIPAIVAASAATS
jgi:Golgi phosphoprotein 3